MLKFKKSAQPTQWQVSADGTKMTGHIVLKRTNCNCGTPSTVPNSSSNSTIDSSCDFNSSMSLGLKIVGGRLNPQLNQLCAYIVKVKKDSVSDTIGRLKAGDEVIKWNGKCLRGLSYDEVFTIMSKSKQDIQVELHVERIIEPTSNETIAFSESKLYNNDESNKSIDVSPMTINSLMETPVNMTSNLDNSLVHMTDVSKSYMEFYEQYDMSNTSSHSIRNNNSIFVTPKTPSHMKHESKIKSFMSVDSDTDSLRHEPLSEQISMTCSNSNIAESEVTSYDSCEDIDTIGHNEPKPICIRTFLRQGYRWRVAYKMIVFIRLVTSLAIKEKQAVSQITSSVSSEMIMTEHSTTTSEDDNDKSEKNMDELDCSSSVNRIRFFDSDSTSKLSSSSIVYRNKHMDSMLKNILTPSDSLSEAMSKSCQVRTTRKSKLERNTSYLKKTKSGSIIVTKMTPSTSQPPTSRSVRSPASYHTPPNRNSLIETNSPPSMNVMNRGFYRRSADVTNSLEDSDTLVPTARQSSLLQSTSSNNKINPLYSIDLKTPVSAVRLRQPSNSSMSLQAKRLSTIEAEFTPYIFNDLYRTKDDMSAFKPNNLSFLMADPMIESPLMTSTQRLEYNGVRMRRRRCTSNENLMLECNAKMLNRKEHILLDNNHVFASLQYPNNTVDSNNNNIEQLPDASKTPTCIQHLVFTIRDLALSSCFYVSPTRNENA